MVVIKLNQTMLSIWKKEQAHTQKSSLCMSLCLTVIPQSGLLGIQGRGTSLFMIFQDILAVKMKGHM